MLSVDTWPRATGAGLGQVRGRQVQLGPGQPASSTGEMWQETGRVWETWWDTWADTMYVTLRTEQ